MTTEEKRKELNRLAKTMFKRYVMDDWQLKYFDSPNKITNVGRCAPELKEIYIANIAIESFTMDSLVDLFKHEFAHGILGLAGILMKHNKIFKQVCKQLGCTGDVTHNHYELDYKNLMPTNKNTAKN